VRILTRSTERKIEDVLGDQFGFRRGTGTRDAIGIKVSPVTCHEGPEEEERYSSTLTNLRARQRWLVNAMPWPLYPWERDLGYPLYRRLCGT
jgi:hypothetical protein